MWNFFIFLEDFRMHDWLKKLLPAMQHAITGCVGIFKETIGAYNNISKGCLVSQRCIPLLNVLRQIN